MDRKALLRLVIFNLALIIAIILISIFQRKDTGKVSSNQEQQVSSDFMNHNQ